MLHKKRSSTRKRVGQKHQFSPTGRRKRKDANIARLLPRDELVLTWIGQQYAMRLDQIQELLGQRTGHGTTYWNQISESATRNVIARWKKAGWVQARRIDAQEPLWVWLTKEGLQRIGLTYQYQSLDRLSKHDRSHLYAITDVRLQLDDGTEGIEWTSERTLLQGVKRAAGYERVHRPDAVFACGDDLIAIEVELSRKTMPLLSHILEDLVSKKSYHGHAYHVLKALVGEEQAQRAFPEARRYYTHVYYYANGPIRKHIRRVLAKLIGQGRLFTEEAKRICVWWYPLPTNEAEVNQEEQEENASVDLEEDEWLFLNKEGGESDLDPLLESRRREIWYTRSRRIPWTNLNQPTQKNSSSKPFICLKVAGRTKHK